MRRKTPGEHLVPLSRQVVTLLTDLQAITGGNPNGLLLPGLVAGKPISDATLGQALKRLGCGPNRIVPHGFRAMASTQLNEQGFAPDLIELQLAHSDSSMRGIYNRATRLPERREMMRWWADRLDALHTAPLRDRTSPASLDGEGGVGRARAEYEGELRALGGVTHRDGGGSGYRGRASRFCAIGRHDRGRRHHRCCGHTAVRVRHWRCPAAHAAVRTVGARRTERDAAGRD